MATPLLPKPRVQDWPTQSAPGLYSINDQDYQRFLCENYFEASAFGTPSPLAQPIVFKERLDQYLLDQQDDQPSGRFDDAFAVWRLLLKALYLQVVTLRPVDLAEFAELGTIVAAELPQGFRLSFLVFDGKVIGITFPEVGFAPSARFDRRLRKELEDEVQRRDLGTASQYFRGWLDRHAEVHDGRLPYYALLLRLGGQWCPEEPPPLPRDPGRLFGPSLSLWLATDAAAGSASLPLYIGTPIVCERCEHEIGERTGSLQITHPNDCRCPSCGHQYDWLREYKDWIRFDETRGTYLVYAFADSPIRHPPHSRYVSYTDDGIVINTGLYSLAVQGLVLTEEALRCDRLIFFTDGDQERQPDLPVRGEFFGLVELHEGTRPSLDRVSGEYRVRLAVNGWAEPVELRYGAKEIQREEALLLSWPRFSLPGWNVQYYLLESTAPMNKAGIGLRALNRDAAPLLLETSRGQLDRPHEAFEVVFRSKSSSADTGAPITAQAGIYTTRREALPKGQAPLTLALDFGTSNSSVWYRLGEGRSKPLRFADYTDTLIGNAVLSHRCLDLAYWLPTYQLDDLATALRFYRDQLDADDSLPTDATDLVRRLDYFLPSELIVWPPLSSQALAVPLAGYRLCHSFAARPHGRVIYNLKTLDVEGNDEGRFTYEQGVSRYLESFLVQALATIAAKEEQAGHLKIRASFPQAFSQEKLRTYHECLTRVLKRVEELTGFSSTGPWYIDEARAAALSLRASEGLTLVMDMGGGTTDIGVFRPRGSKLEPIFSDSLLYGGSAFLRLLAHKDETDVFPRPSIGLGKTDESDGVSEARFLWLMREIRLRGFEAVVRSQYRGSAHSRKVMLDLLVRFYSPLAYFVRRLFEALAIEQEKDPKDLFGERLTFYLVGNGWTLGDAVGPQDAGYGRGYRELMKYLLEKEGFTNLIPTREPGLEGLPWPGPKAAIGAGTIGAEESELFRHFEDASQELHGVRTVAGLDFRLTHGSGDGIPVPWSAAVPMRIDNGSEAGGLRLRPALGELKPQLPKEWDFVRFEPDGEVRELERICFADISGTERPSLTRSVLVRFLENVYRPQLRRARRL